MSYLNIRRILQAAAMVTALAVAGLTAPRSMTAQQPPDDAAQRQQQDLQQEPLQNRDLRQEPMEQEAYGTEVDDGGTSWGWLGLLGLAGLLGLRRRDHDRPVARPTGTTTRAP